MAAIPTYRQQTNTGGPLTGANARGVQVRSALAESNPDIQRAAGGLIRNDIEAAQRLNQQREDDATAWASQSLADTRAKWTQDLIQRRETAEAGAPEFTPNLLKDFDAYAKELIGNAPTQRSKAMMQLRLTDIRSALAQDGLTFESGAKRAWRLDQASQGIDKAAVAVLLDPRQYDAAVAEQITLLGQYQLHGEDFAKAHGLALEKISAAAVTGMIQKAPRETLRALQAQDGGGYKAVNALDAEQRVRFQNQAQARVDHLDAVAKQNQAIARGDFNERVQNASAMLLTLGTAPNAPTQSEFVRMYGAEEGARRYADFQVVEDYGTKLSTVRGMPHAEQLAMLDQSRPTTATENFADAQKGYDMLARAVEETQRQYNDDPARYVLTYTPAVRESYDAMQATLDDPQAQPAARQAASANFLTAMQSEQERLSGTRGPLLPKAYVESVASAFNAQTEGGENAAGMVASLAEQWGTKWPQVYAEMADKLPPDVVTIGSGMAPGPAALVVEAAKLKPGELTDGLPAGSQRDVTDNLTAAMEPFRRVLAPTANGGRQFATFYDSANKLALTYVRQGLAPDEAATRAANDVIGDRYEFADTYMVPRSQPIDLIESGAASLLASIPPESIAVAPTSLMGRTPEAYRAEVARSLSDQGYWGNAPQDAGLLLYAPNGQPVLRADGNPYIVGWGELAEAGRKVYRPVTDADILARDY